MKPYYEHGGVSIYLGDCREVMLGLPSVDLVITDPPYGMNFQSNHRNTKHLKIEGDEALDVETLRLCISKAERAAYLFCRWDNLREMPLPKSVLCWVKNNWSMGDLEHEHGRQWEAICFYPGARHEFIKRIPDVIYSNRTGNALHPTQKPRDLLAKLMTCSVGDLILDPYMGSGTTLDAAKQLGRRAIGIEINERYCEIAAKRLSQEVFEFEGGITCD